MCSALHWAPPEVGTLISPILYMRELKHRSLCNLPKAKYVVSYGTSMHKKCACVCRDVQLRIRGWIQMIIMNLKIRWLLFVDMHAEMFHFVNSGFSWQNNFNEFLLLYMYFITDFIFFFKAVLSSQQNGAEGPEIFRVSPTLRMHNLHCQHPPLEWYVC